MAMLKRGRGRPRKFPLVEVITLSLLVLGGFWVYNNRQLVKAKINEILTKLKLPPI